MTPEPKPDLARLVESVEALRHEVARLADRVSALEAAEAPARSAPVDQETVFIIAAAVAAFLGKRAHIRQIRLIGSEAWARQGRVTVQASHALPRSSMERSER